MIFLKDTSSILRLITSSVADIDFAIDWVDLTTTAATPSATEGKITTATTTTILAAPAASTVRQIKQIVAANIHGSLPNTIQVIKEVSAVQYKIHEITIQAGEVARYLDGVGWSTGVFSNSTFDGFIDLGGIADPVAPATNTLRFYSKSVVGRMLPKWKGTSGLDTPFQPALFGNNVVMWNPGATSGVAFGTVTTAITAGVVQLPTTTNKYTTLRRNSFTAATGANLQNSIRTENMFFRGGALTQGGFFFFCRFGLQVWTTGNRLFVGLAADTTALVTADPSTRLNVVGFGVDTADSAITIMHNDSSGLATKVAIPGQPALSTSNAYDAYIFCKPFDTTVYFRLDDSNAGTTIIDTSVSGAELPAVATMLNAVAAIGSGTNTGSTVASIGVNRIYVETDY